METPWQLAWVIDRLTPRWIVEEIAGRRPKVVRISFFDAAPDVVERVVLRVVARMGKDWRVDMRALHPDEFPAVAWQPTDLVWAIGSLSRIAIADRRRVVDTLATALAPGGCFIVEPAETIVLDAGLSPTSSPGVFLRCD